MLRERDEIMTGGERLPVYSMNTLVIGSGAAGLKAALRLSELGQDDVAIVTERWGAGASFEAGSDKQTYYRLSAVHEVADSPRRMAEDLCRGGCMHGDIALCEAQQSPEAFYDLVRLGVPFPHDAYGAYVGYRTDHDPAGRGTSAGPLTSRMMCEALGRAVRERAVRVFDRHQVVALLTMKDGQGKRVCGAVAFDRGASEAEAAGMVLFNAVNVVLATGGPGGLYEASVYPESQNGSIGLALTIGAVAQNLTEWQFGIASIQPRWNLSGSYQQVVPRYVSTDADGGDEREFLNECFDDVGSMASAVFRKGYEWPFDCTKVAGGGSSLVDLLVDRERVERGRRVFLDYRRNPKGLGDAGAFEAAQLEDEVRLYLERSAATGATPIERLRAMNEPAYQFFRGHGVDLARDRLEIGVCAQHNNGGLRGNMWWETSVRHLFAVGEVNGSHGVVRPGGAALNAGQVGAMRAAMYIAKRYGEAPKSVEVFAAGASDQVAALRRRAGAVREHGGAAGVTVGEIVREVRQTMSRCGGLARDPQRIERGAVEMWKVWDHARSAVGAASMSEVPGAFRAVDLCLTAAMYLEAMGEYLKRGGGSRGSCLVVDGGGAPLHETLGESWRFRMADASAPVSREILETWLGDEGSVCMAWRETRPIPEGEGWFEEVWRSFRADDVIR